MFGDAWERNKEIMLRILIGAWLSILLILIIIGFVQKRDEHRLKGFPGYKDDIMELYQQAPSESESSYTEPDLERDREKAPPKKYSSNGKIIIITEESTFKKDPH